MQVLCQPPNKHRRKRKKRKRERTSRPTARMETKNSSLTRKRKNCQKQKVEMKEPVQ